MSFRHVSDPLPKLPEQQPENDLALVTRTTARAFMEAERERNVSGKTWNDTMKLLRAAFHHLLPPGVLNPLEDMPTKDAETVFRKPFTPEELKAILEEAKDDDFIRPIIITGMCTAMRRGDCCLLKWKDVDMARRFITVKTAKTGQTVTIPIFPLLLDELASLPASKLDLPSGKDLVFPDQAAMYEENPDGITWRVKKVLAGALGGVEEAADALPEASEAEMRELLEAVKPKTLRERLLKVWASL
jgi:integrase